MLAEKLILAKGVKNDEAKISLIMLSLPRKIGKNINTMETMNK